MLEDRLCRDDPSDGSNIKALVDQTPQCVRSFSLSEEQGTVKQMDSVGLRLWTV